MTAENSNFKFMRILVRFFGVLCDYYCIVFTKRQETKQMDSSGIAKQKRKTRHTIYIVDHLQTRLKGKTEDFELCPPPAVAVHSVFSVPRCALIAR